MNRDDADSIATWMQIKNLAMRKVVDELRVEEDKTNHPMKTIMAEYIMNLVIAERMNDGRYKTSMLDCGEAASMRTQKEREATYQDYREEKTTIMGSVETEIAIGYFAEEESGDSDMGGAEQRFLEELKKIIGKDEEYTKKAGEKVENVTANLINEEEKQILSIPKDPIKY